ncbi:Copia protein [Glycine soja]|uniref:Copia protein n=1 Tax=Glycine soja TaxID=3848 RepID=A0A445KFS5_GLYSO|nr:Copia protein [Glycine soja]
MAMEFIACFEASNHGIWLRNFITGLRVVDVIERPLKIYCDNNSAVLYSNNNRSATKSKFIDIKFLVVKERVHNRQISIEHLRTNDMLANPLTKVISYTRTLRITLKTKKGFIDEKKFKFYAVKAFEVISKATMEIPNKSKC